MATVHPFHYQPSAAQKQELADALDKIKAAHMKRCVQRISDAVSAAPIMDMLAVVVSTSPLDNPVIESNFGAL